MRRVETLYYTIDGVEPGARAANSPDGLPVRRDTDEGQSLRNPAGYVPDDDLAAAINIAIILGRPLLVTGEPGTGKSELAAHLAHRLRLGKRIKVEVKSTSTSTELFYTFDSLRQFRDANLQDRLGKTGTQKDGSWIRPYITFQGLGLAILRTHTADDPVVERYWDEDRYGAFDGPKRSVVLIDEVDKAPREMLNDLLNEIELHYFRVMEDEGRIVRLQHGLVPVVVITSNSEKNLPDAFLRRCIFHQLSFPDINAQDKEASQKEVERIMSIVASRFEHYPTSCRLLTDAIDFMKELRSEKLGLAKPPATAELLDWLSVLHEAGFERDDTLRKRSEMRTTLGALLKNADDLQVAEMRALKGWLDSDAGH